MVWYTDCQISVTASTLLPRLLIGVNIFMFCSKRYYIVAIKPKFIFATDGLLTSPL